MDEVSRRRWEKAPTAKDVLLKDCLAKSAEIADDIKAEHVIVVMVDPEGVTHLLQAGSHTRLSQFGMLVQANSILHSMD